MNLAAKMDHTLLDREAEESALRRVCEEALEFGFKTVCVFPEHVAMVAERLRGSGMVPIAVAGFPTGLESTGEKVDQARAAVADGAREIDMVINSEALAAGDYQKVMRDVGAVVAACAPWSVKVILETAALDDEGIMLGCVLSKAAGAAFVKTSTGFGPGGATLKAVGLMRRIVGPEMGVKASGGIKTREQAEAMVRAGADRIGTSASVAIVQETMGGGRY